MKITFLLASRLTSVIALLGAAHIGCTAVDSSDDETSEEAFDRSDSSSDSSNDSSNDSTRAAAPAGSKASGSSHLDSPVDENSIENGSAVAASPVGGSDENGMIQADSAGNGDSAAGGLEGEQMPMLAIPNLFQAANAWTKDVSGLVKHAKSTTITNWLNANGGWGMGVMKIDFSITVLDADSSTPKKTFTKTSDFYSPDCDQVAIPVPAVGNLEGEQGYACANDGDCHLIVVNKSENKLYEMWRANITNGTFVGGCTAVWDLTKSYSSTLRGDGCTSADAAGLPIAATLFSAQEVKAGVIDHAIRFILPNSRIRDNVYVRPATHSTFATSGGPDAPPYGVRFRLRKDFPLNTLPTEGARVVARAIQKYGMILSDGGNIALTAASDRYSPVKWADVGVNSNSLKLLKVTDMEVVDMGTPISWSESCVRNP